MTRTGPPSLCIRPLPWATTSNCPLAWLCQLLPAIAACFSFALLPYLPKGAVWPEAAALIAFRTSFALLDVPQMQ
ncbi:hypothetical protein [Sphingobium yanoikuyae]|uniref:hypothetical protein n=1 Tax=Sphingobium yanoikuyae TaxID=13690 RepID=UPI002FDB645B